VSKLANKKNLENIVKLNENLFEELLVKYMQQSYEVYQQYVDLYQQWIYDKERYYLRYFYDKETGELFYTKKRKQSIGFKVNDKYKKNSD